MYICRLCFFESEYAEHARFTTCCVYSPSVILDKALAHQLRKSFTVYGLRLSEDALRYGCPWSSKGTDVDMATCDSSHLPTLNGVITVQSFRTPIFQTSRHVWSCDWQVRFRPRFGSWRPKKVSHLIEAVRVWVTAQSGFICQRNSRPQWTSKGLNAFRLQFVKMRFLKEKEIRDLWFVPHREAHGQIFPIGRPDRTARMLKQISPSDRHWLLKMINQ